MSRPTILTVISIALLCSQALSVAAQQKLNTVQPKLNIEQAPSSTPSSKFKGTPNLAPVRKLCKVCVETAKATEPGQLFGPCIRYEYQPCPSPAILK